MTLCLRDIRRQCLAGSAFTQHTMATCAALKVQCCRHFKFGCRQDRAVLGDYLRGTARRNSQWRTFIAQLAFCRTDMTLTFGPISESQLGADRTDLSNADRRA